MGPVMRWFTSLFRRWAAKGCAVSQQDVNGGAARRLEERSRGATKGSRQVPEEGEGRKTNGKVPNGRIPGVTGKFRGGTPAPLGPP